MSWEKQSSVLGFFSGVSFLFFWGGGEGGVIGIGGIGDFVGVCMEGEMVNV